MFLLLVLFIFLTNYVIISDMSENSKMIYFIASTIIIVLVILSKIL